MPTKVINNAAGAWTTGATWQTFIDSGASQMVADMVNNSGGPLYVGDCVISDPTGTFCSTTTTLGHPWAVGVVGGNTNQPADGGPIPLMLTNTRYDSVGTTSGSTTVTDTGALPADVNKAIVGPGIPSGAYIVSVMANTSFIISVAATATATVTASIGPRTSATGPGWMGVPTPTAPSGEQSPYTTAPVYFSGETCPVVIGGWAWVNIGTNTVTPATPPTTATTLLQTTTTAGVAALTGGTPAAGVNFAVALEPSSAGITSSNPAGAYKLIRAWIAKQ